MIYKGNVQKLGDSVDTDGMIAGRYLSILNPAELAKHIFEGTIPDFAKRVKPGDMIARNPKNHDDQWLVAAAYFADNFEPLVGA